MLPAYQRPETAHAAVKKRNLRLEEQPEIPLSKRPAQAVRKQHAFGDARRHLRMVQAIVAPAARLHAVERRVCRLDQAVGRLAVFGKDRHADAGASRDKVAVNVEGGRKRLEYLFAHRGPVLDGGYALNQDHELVTAEARDGVLIP
jgi:hypothetical protein